MYLAFYTVKCHWNFTSICLSLFLAIKNLDGGGGIFRRKCFAPNLLINKLYENGYLKLI